MRNLVYCEKFQILLPKRHQPLEAYIKTIERCVFSLFKWLLTWAEYWSPRKSPSLTLTAPKISCDFRTGDSALAACLIFFFSTIEIFSDLDLGSGEAKELSSSSCYSFCSSYCSSSITIVLESFFYGLVDLAAAPLDLDSSGSSWEPMVWSLTAPSSKFSPFNELFFSFSFSISLLSNGK